MNAPTLCPDPCLSLPVEFHRARDGDTPEVKLRGGNIVWPLRLAECDSPELNDPDPDMCRIAEEAHQYAIDVMQAADDMRWYYPFTSNFSFEDFNFLKLANFDRYKDAWLFIGPTQTLNRMLVQRGLASTKSLKRGGRLGT